MRDPKKQAQAQAQAQGQAREETKELINERYGKNRPRQEDEERETEREDFLYCDTDSIITTERGWSKTERKENEVFCKWQKILRNREVVTDSVEKSVYAEYIRQCVNEYSEEYLGDKEVYFIATLKMSEEEPTLRLDVCEGDSNCFMWLAEGLRYSGLLDFRYVSPSSIEIVFKNLVRKMLKREEERLRLTGLRQSLSSVILTTVVWLVNEYDYVNLPEDGIL